MGFCVCSCSFSASRWGWVFHSSVFFFFVLFFTVSRSSIVSRGLGGRVLRNKRREASLAVSSEWCQKNFMLSSWLLFQRKRKRKPDDDTVSISSVDSLEAFNPNGTIKVSHWLFLSFVVYVICVFVLFFMFNLLWFVVRWWWWHAQARV